ncbi:MAG: TIGR04013 family B12-binding domain/radical SAM domain-containing protein [Promethearchaeia archaeon]
MNLVFYYNRQNRYSLNAIIAASEIDDFLKESRFYIVKKRKDLLKTLKKCIGSSQKTVLCISFFTPQLWEIKKLIKKIKRKFKKKVIAVAGGPHPTGDPKDCLKMGFDYVVRGEGEGTFPELVKSLITHKDKRKIKGISFIDENREYLYTGKRSYIDLDNYPPFPLEYTNYGPIEITRGCPYMCYFCQTSFLCGTIPRHRSIEEICKYITILKEENLTDIRFITPNAFAYGSKDGKEINLEKVEELLKQVKEIIGENGRIFFGSFPSEVRPEHVSEKSLSLIKKYGDNDNIIIGAQSGSQRMLNICHRGHTVDDIYNAVTISNKMGLKTNIDFIFGLPKETTEDIQQTIKVMEDLIKRGGRVHAHTFMPLPQTPFENKTVTKLDKKLKKKLQDMNYRGNLYGDWRKQEKLALKVSKYLRNN